MKYLVFDNLLGIENIKRYDRLLDKIKTNRYLYWWVVRYNMEIQKRHGRRAEGDIRHSGGRKGLNRKRFSGECDWSSQTKSYHAEAATFYMDVVSWD